MSYLYGLVFILLILLLRKTLPVSGDTPPYKTVQQLRKEYMATDFKLQGIFLLIAVVIGFSLYYLLPLLVDFRLSLIKEKQFTLRPNHDMMIVSCLFTGLVTGALLSMAYIKYTLKDQWTEFLTYQRLKYKFNFPVVMKYTLGVTTVIAGILTIFVLDCFMVFTTNTIEVNKLFSLGTKTYPYTEVKAIKAIESFTAPNGNIVYTPHYVILFTDDSEWNSRKESVDNYPDQQQLTSWLADKTGKQPVALEME